MSAVPSAIQQSFISFNLLPDTPKFTIIDYCIWNKKWSVLTKVFRQLDSTIGYGKSFSKSQQFKKSNRIYKKRLWRQRKYIPLPIKNYSPSAKRQERLSKEYILRMARNADQINETIKVNDHRRN
jgi:hypothetical protein